jgi:hypothetical protein
MVSFVTVVSSLVYWTAAVSVVFAMDTSLSGSPPLSIQRGTHRRVEVFREAHAKRPDDDDSDDSTPDSIYRCTVFGTTDTPEYPWCPEGKDIDRCTVRGTTDTPMYPWCPDGVGEENDDSTDDYAPNDDAIGDDRHDYDETKDCAAIAKGSASTADWEHSRYQIDLALEIDGDVAETLSRLEVFLQEYIATDLAGCNDNKDRGVEIQNVVFDVSEDTKSGMFQFISVDIVVCRQSYLTFIAVRHCNVQNPTVMTAPTQMFLRTFTMVTKRMIVW